MNGFTGAFAPMVVTERNGGDESLHAGAGVAIDGTGRIVASIGDPAVDIYPRSCLKPLQATAMVAMGLELPDDLLALACASHDGDTVHLAGVRRILELFGLDEADLDNTPSLPFGAAARRAALAAGREAASIYQNCSGKHAAMLATCRVNGWPTRGYRAPDHPVQEAITATIDELAGPVGGIGVDGCGAPTHVVGLTQLASSFARIARGGSLVASSMTTAPDLVAGLDRDVTVLMRTIPGLVAKDGADGVMAVALPDGRAAALKIAGGSDTARRVATSAALAAIGVDVGEALGATLAEPVRGHGDVVGWWRAIPWEQCR
jgi:L-asparaginase II